MSLISIWATWPNLDRYPTGSESESQLKLMLRGDDSYIKLN